MKCFIDGDQLCITKDDFINLQESEAVFIPISKEDITKIEELKETKYYKKCLKIAEEAHKGQKRKNTGDPYITHPLRVANKFEDDIYKSVAILHDVLEDTKITSRDLREEGICNAIISSVEILSRKTDQTYFNFILSINKRGGNLVNEIKIADIEDNMSDLKEGTLKDKYRFAKELLQKGLKQ